MTGSKPTNHANYVISLQGAENRRKRFQASVAESEKVEIFDAITSLSPYLSYSENAAIACKGRPLSRGELGCYSSHFTVWKKFLSSKSDSAIVLEDDVIADWTALSLIVDFARSHPEIGYLRLYAKRPCAMHILAEGIAGGRAVVDYRGFAYGTQAYYLTRAAAVRLVDHCRKVRRCVDDEMDRSWAHGIPNLAIFPFPVFEASFGSTIGEARYNAPPIPNMLRWRRMLARVSDRRLRIMQSLTRYGLVHRLIY